MNENNTENKEGRPTKYKPEYCQEMIDYFNREPLEVILIKNKKGNEEPHEIPCQFPTFEGFINKIGICKQTLLNWTKEYSEFLDAYEQCKNYQKDILVQNGLRGNYNCLFAKFVAINATDMVEKQEIDNTISIKDFPEIAKKIREIVKK